MNSVITRSMFVPMLNIMTSSQKWQLKSQNVEDVIFEEIKLRELSFTHVLLTPVTIQLHCKLYKFT